MLSVRGSLQVLTVSRRAALAAGSMGKVPVLHDSPGVRELPRRCTVQVAAARPAEEALSPEATQANVLLLVAHHRRCQLSGTW